MLVRLSVAYLSGRVLPLLLAAAAIPIYTRLLSPEEYGKYATVMALVVLADAALFQWARLGLMRHLDRFPEGPAVLRGTLYAAAWVPALMLMSVLGLMILWFWPALWSTFVWVLVLVNCYAWFEFASFNAIAEQRPGTFASLGAAKAALALAVGVFLAYRNLGATAALTGVLVGCLIAPLAFGQGSWRVTTFRRSSVRHIGPVLAYSLPLIPTFLLSWIIQGSDRLILAWLADATAVGQYVVGYDLAQFGVNALLVSVNLAAYPLAIKAMDSGGMESARVQIRRNGELLVSIATACAVGISVLAGPLSELLVGPEYVESAATILPIVALAAALAGLKAYHFDVALHLRQRSGSLLICVLIGAATNLGLNLLLIPRLGIVGAAWATVFAYLMAAIASFLISRRIFDVPTLWPILVKAGSVALAAGAGAVISLQLLAGRPAALVSVVGIVLGASLAAAFVFALDIAGIRTDRRVPAQKSS